MIHAGPYARRTALGSAVAYSIPQTNLIEDWNMQVPGTYTIDPVNLCTYSGLNPIPTLSLTVPNIPIWLGVRTGGANGAGLLNLSLDGGGNFYAQNFTIPSSFFDVTIPPNIGTGTMRITFPVGTYQTGATYVSRINSWIGTKGNFTWVQDSGQPASGDRGPILTARGSLNNGLNRQGRGVMGKLAVATGSNGYLVSTIGNLANAIGGGTNKPFHMFLVGSYDSTLVSTSNQQVLVGLARAATNPRITSVDAVGDGAGNAGYTTARINDAASNANQFLPSALTPQANVIRIAFVFEIEFDGSTTTIRKTTAAGTTVLSSGNNSGGTFTLTQAVLFALKRTTISNNATASLCRIAIYSAVQTGSTVNNIRTTLVNQHDILASKVMKNVIVGASNSSISRGNLVWPSYMMYGNDVVTVNNYATPGWTTTDMVANLPTAMATYDGSLGVGHNVYWFCVEGPTLGINGGAGNLAQAQADTVTCVSTAKSTGFKVVIKTVIPGGTNPAFETNRLAYNSWVRSGASGADVVDDIASRWGYIPGDNIGYDIGDNLHTSYQGASWTAGSEDLGGSERLYRTLSKLAA